MNFKVSDTKLELVREEMNRQSKYMARADGKNIRNLNRYQNNGMRKEDIWQLYSNPSGLFYYNSTDEADLGPGPATNVIRSVIDTKVSKMSQSKVRPFFNPVNGLFHTRQVCKAGQIFFDEWYQEKNVYQSAILAYRDAQIFGYGVVWIDDRDQIPRRIAPWSLMLDPAEHTYGHYSGCTLEFRYFPLWYYKDEIDRAQQDGMDVPQKELLENNIHAVGKVRLYYDFLEHVKYTFVGDYLIDLKDIKFEQPPVAIVHYQNPIKGIFAPSVADNLYLIQRKVDAINTVIHEALELNPANMIFIPTTSGVKESTLSNRVAGTYEFNALPNTNIPVTVVTPAPISDQYQKWLEFYMKQAYEMEGVTQLSAQGKKPSGLNSGVALDTMEDIESERFNTELQAQIKFLMDICKKAIDVFPEEDSILPKRIGRDEVTWADIKKEKENYSIQFAAASELSKEPKTKMEEAEKLLQMGIIDQDTAKELLEFPDTERGFNSATAAHDEIERIIERAVNNEDYVFYETIDFNALKAETFRTIQSLDANNEDPVIINNLVELYHKIKHLTDGVQQMNNAAIAAAQPPTAPGAVPGTPPSEQLAPPPAYGGVERTALGIQAGPTPAPGPTGQV